MAEIVDFGLQQHKIKMDSRYFENVLSVVAGDTGRRIEVQLLDTNGMVQDTTGLNLRLNAEIAGKATFTDAALVDATTGKYQLDLSNGMFLAPGNWQFQWQITDSAGKKLHSFAFTGNIGKNISEGGTEGKNFYFNIEDLKQMQVDIKLIQEDFVNGTIDSAVLETTIADKLTALETEYSPKLTEVGSQVMQTDFVSQISKIIGGYEKMYYKRENSLGWVTVMLRNKSEHVSWTFRNNVYDDFYILGDCFYGSITESLAIYQNENYEVTTGTGWVKTAANAHYTTVIGDTMTNYIEGEKIEFHHFSDNRGGIWEFVVDDIIDKPILISTWSETVVATNNKTIIEGLPFGTHKVVAIFRGDDPLHVPSTGAGTSRGWVYVNGLNNYLTFRSFKTQLLNSRVKDLLVGFSNKEFAFSIRQQGSTAPYQFVPMHNNIGTAFEKQPVKFIADSDVLNKSQINALIISEFIECGKFSVIQSIYGRNPNNGATNLLEINTNVTINKNGNVEITGKMKPLVNIEIDNGYGIMLPVNKGVATKSISSKGNEYPITKTDGTSTFLDNEGDSTTSFLFVSSESPDYAVSEKFNDVRNTLRSGQNKGTTVAPLWIEHRDATMQKLYFRQFYKQSLTPDDTFKFSATLNCGKINDIFNLM